MEHAGDIGKFPDDVHAVLMGFPLVDDHRQAAFPGQRHLHPKGPLLDLPGNILIVVVQTDFSNGPDFGVLFP